MTKAHAPLAIVFLVTLGCMAMAWVENCLHPAYPVKTLLKVLVFLGCVGIYALLDKSGSPMSCLRLRPVSAWVVGLAGLVFALLLGGYFLLSPWLDLSAIPGRLAEKEGITAATFPLVAVYITFVNSLLEEFFFRGFAFLSLREAGWRRLCWPFSALAFALYHICIMDGWFPLPLLLLLTAALAVCGLFFNWLDRRGSLWCSWLVHMGANLAINTIALHLFGLI